MRRLPFLRGALIIERRYRAALFQGQRRGILKEALVERAAQKNGPAVIRFKAQIVQHPDGGKTAKIVLDLPKPIAAKLRGMITIEGVINGHPFRAPIEDRFLRVNSAMLRGASARIGEFAQLAVLGPEPEPAIPRDLGSAFSKYPDAKVLWKELTLLARLDWIRWIDGAKTPDTRARRITRTVEQLAEGKRRPCCVNFYEYMLSRVGDAR